MGPPQESNQTFKDHLKEIQAWITPEQYQLIANDPKCASAFQSAKIQLSLSLLNHSVRVYLYAQRTALKQFPSWQSKFRDYPDIPPSNLIYIAAMMHDVGVATVHDHSDQRFEVEGADAAVDLMLEHGASKSEMADVWEAIVLHTSPGIAERLSPMTLCMRAGPKIDFDLKNKFESEEAIQPFRTEVEAALPRLSIEKVLGDTVIRQAVNKPVKAPQVSWPWCLLLSRQKDPDFEGVDPVL